MDEFQNNCGEWKKPDKNEDILYGSTFISSGKWQEADQWLPRKARGWGGGTDYRGAWRNFCGWWICPLSWLWWWFAHTSQTLSNCPFFLKLRWNVVSLPTIRLAKTNKHDNTPCWCGYGQISTLVRCWWECKLLWKVIYQFSI